MVCIKADRTFDAVIVGARAAGASLAINLAKSGRRVALIDRATFPSDTMSTHVFYPNSIARLEAMGVLDDILAHGPPPLHTAWHHEDVRSSRRTRRARVATGHSAYGASRSTKSLCDGRRHWVRSSTNRHR